jgi:hypothetical protein
VVERKPQVNLRPAHPASGAATPDRKNDGTGRG